jgi:hypothetical protein
MSRGRGRCTKCKNPIRDILDKQARRKPPADAWSYGI